MPKPPKPAGAEMVSSLEKEGFTVLRVRGSHCVLSAYSKQIHMRNETTVAKWGNSLALRIPLAIARQASLSEGDCLALPLDSDGGIVLRPARRRYELAELVAQIMPENSHRETDWGQPQGVSGKARVIAPRSATDGSCLESSVVANIYVSIQLCSTFGSI